MPKPRKKRQVQYPPPVVFFKPNGVPLWALEKVVITVDEYEAVRLSDYEEMKHEAAASEMNISRPTFTRLIQSAHKKLAEAVVMGKAIVIEGGPVSLAGNRFVCKQCQYIWMQESNVCFPEKCPKCESLSITDLASQCGFEKGCHGKGKGRQRKGRRAEHNFGMED